MKIFDPVGFSSKLTGSFSGSFTGDGSSLTGTISSSIATTASYIKLSNVDGSASLASRIFTNSSSIGSLNASSGSYANSASFASDISTNSASIASLETVSGSYANSASFASDISTNSASIASLETVSGSYANSASFASSISANSSSIGSLNAVSSSYLLNTTDTLTGDLTVTGNIIATTLNVQDVTASIVYSSGSNIFGSSSIDTQQFTGSIKVSGSIDLQAGDATFAGSVGVAGSSIVEKFNTPNIKIAGSTITGTVSANTLLIDNLSSTSRFFSCGADSSTNGTFNFNTGTSAALGTTMLTLASTGATFTGAVGIGGSPSHPLDVKGADTNNATIARFYSNTGTRGSFVINNGTGVSPTTFIGTAGGSEQLSIGTNSTEAIRIDGSQNSIFKGTFEINSTSVYQAKIKSTGAQYLLIGSTDASSAGIVLDGDSNGDGSGGDYSYIIHEASGILKLQQDSPSGTNELHFGTGGTEGRMIINSGGDILMGNTVVNPASGFASQKGFGYDAGTGQTQIATTDNASTLVLGRNNATDGSIIDLRKESTVIGIIGSNSAGGQPFLDISANSTNGNMRFLTANAERIRIVSAGAVGIDNSSPDSFNGSGSITSSLVIGKGTNSISPQLTLWQGNSAQATINFASANSGTGQYEGRIRYTRDTGIMDFRTNGIADVLVLNASGDATFAGNIFLPDTKKIVLGSSSDFQLYHDGSNSYIQNLIGWLNIPLSQNGISIANADFSESIARFLLNGAVELYYDGAKKFETVSTGVDVFGTSGNTNIRIYDSSANSEVGLKLQGDAATWTLQNWGSGGDKLRILNNAGTSIQVWEDDGSVIFGGTDINGAFGASNTILAVQGSTSGGEGIIQITGKGNNATDNVGKIDFHSYTEADAMCSIRSVRGSADDQGELQIWTNSGGAPTEKFTVSKDGLVYVNKEGYADGGFITGFRTAIQVGQSAVAIGKVATYGGLAMVWVNYVGNIAYDLVSYSLSSVTVLSSQNISGGAAARTYTAVSGVLKLTMTASDTYSVYATEIRTANT